MVATVSELRHGVSGVTHQHHGNARDENNSGRRGKLPSVRLNESPAQRRLSVFFQSADRFQRFSPLEGKVLMQVPEDLSKPAPGRFQVISILEI